MLISGSSWICRQSGVNTGFSKVVRPESQRGSNWIQLETVFEGAWTPGWQPLRGDSNYFILRKISSLKEPGGGTWAGTGWNKCHRGAAHRQGDKG